MSPSVTDAISLITRYGRKPTKKKILTTNEVFVTFIGDSNLLVIWVDLAVFCNLVLSSSSLTVFSKFLSIAFCVVIDLVWCIVESIFDDLN